MVELKDEADLAVTKGGELRRVCAQAPGFADAHYNLAGIYERRGDKAAALRHLKACRSAKQ